MSYYTLARLDIYTFHILKQNEHILRPDQEYLRVLREEGNVTVKLAYR